MVNRARVSGKIPAGYTYLGQFISHDLSFVSMGLTNQADQINSAEELETSRTPCLDLDSVYGAHCDYAVDSTTGKFELGKTIPGSGFPCVCDDLPRNKETKIAKIPDERNDENLLVAQLHVIFLKFHNRVVALESERHPSEPPDALFERGKSQTIKAYQRIVLRDFLPRVCQRWILEVPWSAPWVSEIFRTSKLPLEFVGSAFRFGHAMVRSGYRLNSSSFDLAELFRHTGREMANAHGFPSSHVPLWNNFFRSRLVPGAGPQLANSVYPALAQALSVVSVDGSKACLARLNLERGQRWRLASGQALARYIQSVLKGYQAPADIVDRLAPLTDETVRRFSPDQELLKRSGMTSDLPLWYYCLLEAAVANAQHTPEQSPKGRGGLGPLASFLVAGTLHAAVSKAALSSGIENSFASGQFLAYMRRKNAILAKRRAQLSEKEGDGHAIANKRPEPASMIDFIEFANESELTFL